MLKRLLMRNSVLSILDLSGTGLGNKGVQMLCEGLNINLGLLSLNLSNNDISTAGCEYIQNSLSKSKL